MNHQQLSQATIWATADKYLRGIFTPAKYGDVIIPMMVLRRLECILEATKGQVVEYFDTAADAPEHVHEMIIRTRFKIPFYNSSKLDLGRIAAVDDQVLAAFNTYLDGFSSNVRDIFEAYELRKTAATLDQKNRLWQVIQHFSIIDLHPDAMSDTGMGDLFEDLMYRNFSSNASDAGAFYTPRDAISLLVDILIASDQEGLRGKAPVRSVYDPTAGTGGMLLVAKRALEDLNPNIDVSLFGQELMPYSYAIGKADLIIQGERPDAIREGDTLTEDKHPGETFDYVLSNPPYGSDWSGVKPAVLKDPRFAHGVPGTNDGQMLFLSHVVSKMTPAGANGAGGRAGVIMNGSPLFSGGPGSGPDSIRSWLLKSDLVDAIVMLPTDMFYGTGISTYIWLLDQNKEERRRGKIQLLDASNAWSPMRKGLGDKRREMTPEDRAPIVAAYEAFEESDISKIVTADDLGYRDVPVYKVRRLATKITEDALEQIMTHKSATPGTEAVVREVDGAPYNTLPTRLKNAAKAHGEKMPIGLLDAIIDAIGVDDPEAPEAIDRKGNPVTDPSFKMTERIPLSEDIAEHMEREVLPFAPDARWDASKAKVGYEIPMTRLFYKPTPVRPLAEIDADVQRLMSELADMFGKVKA